MFLLFDKLNLLITCEIIPQVIHVNDACKYVCNKWIKKELGNGKYVFFYKNENDDLMFLKYNETHLESNEMPYKCIWNSFKTDIHELMREDGKHFVIYVDPITKILKCNLQDQIVIHPKITFHDCSTLKIVETNFPYLKE